VAPCTTCHERSCRLATRSRRNSLVQHQKAHRTAGDKKRSERRAAAGTRPSRADSHRQGAIRAGHDVSGWRCEVEGAAVGTRPDRANNSREGVTGEGHDVDGWRGEGQSTGVGENEEMGV